MGYVTYIFAVIAIFFGMEYGDVNMPKEVTYVLIAYVVIHVAVHLILTFQRCYLYHHGDNQVKDVYTGGAPSASSEDEAGSDLRKALAFVYVGLVWIFALVIIGWVIHQKIYAEDHEHHEHEEH